jgi:mono/diheme cytochrome c family protein
MRKGIAVAFAVLLVGAALPMFADSTPDGAAIYKAKCAVCHGPDGKKVNKAMGTKDLTSAEVQKASDQELYDVTAKGKGKMPAFKAKLSDAEIKSLVVTIRDLAKK